MFEYFRKKLFYVMVLILYANNVVAAEILTPARQVYISDFETGKVLFSKDAEQPMKPASMAKIMTVFIVFQRITEGSLNNRGKINTKALKHQ